MNEQRIHELISRYFDGMTSLDEERELHQYFVGDDIPDSLKVYRPMFVFFAEEQMIDPPVKKSAARTIGLNWAMVTGIAASIAILFLIAIPKSGKEYEKYVYYVDGQRIHNETIALESAENKLQMLAESMQKAKNSMSAFEKVQASNQSLQQFDKISNAYRQLEEVGVKLQEVTSSNQ